jgi:2-C-methyl-D-erythritol 4-phosphate cytidylyltransferase
VIAAAPVTDTVKRAVEETSAELGTSGVPDSALKVLTSEDRSELWAAQTPQMFRTTALREALAAAERPQEATDEAMLVEWNGGTVLIHPVTEPNLKVTTPLDLRVAELLLAERRALAAPLIAQEHVDERGREADLADAEGDPEPGSQQPRDGGAEGEGD